MKQSIDSILQKIRPGISLIQRNTTFIFIVGLLGIYIYLVNHIGSLITNEPTQSQVDTQLKPISKLRVDQSAVTRMTQLEAQNIEVKSLFDQARQNPFTE